MSEILTDETFRCLNCEYVGHTNIKAVSSPVRGQPLDCLPRCYECNSENIKIDDYQALELQLKSARKVIEFYGGEENWKLAGFDAYYNRLPIVGIAKDKGKQARKWLEENK